MGTRFPKSSAKRGMPSKTCRQGRPNTACQVEMPRGPGLPVGFGPSLPISHPFFSVRLRAQALRNPSVCFVKVFISKVIMSEACFLTSKNFIVSRNLHISLCAGGQDCYQSILQCHKGMVMRLPQKRGSLFTPIHKCLADEKC